jgi:hypothetical protein
MEVCDDCAISGSNVKFLGWCCGKYNAGERETGSEETTYASKLVSILQHTFGQDNVYPQAVDNNVFEWEVMLMISDDVKLYGGM